MLFRSDRKSTRLNSSHTIISYAVFCLKKKKKKDEADQAQPELPAGAKKLGTKSAGENRAARQEWRFEKQADVVSKSSIFFFFLMKGEPPRSTLFPYPPLFR